MKTNELIGAALDWAVAKCEGFKPADLYIDRYKGSPPEEARIWTRTKDEDGKYDGCYMTGPDRLYSQKWEAGGPIIEREKITIGPDPEHGWCGAYDVKRCAFGPTSLIAAMRCYVMSKLGDEVKIPKELTNEPR